MPEIIDIANLGELPFHVQHALVWGWRGDLESGVRRFDEIRSRYDCPMPEQVFRHGIDIWFPCWKVPTVEAI